MSEIKAIYFVVVAIVTVDVAAVVCVVVVVVHTLQQLQSTTLHSSCCQSINCSLSTHCQLARLPVRSCPSQVLRQIIFFAAFAIFLFPFVCRFSFFFVFCLVAADIFNKLPGSRCTSSQQQQQQQTLQAAKLKMKFVARIDFPNIWASKKGNSQTDKQTEKEREREGARVHCETSKGTKHVEYDRNSKMKQFTCIFDTVGQGQLSYMRNEGELVRQLIK